MLKEIDLVIFDLDGTLVDSTDAICYTFNHVLQQQQMPIVEHALISAMIGQPLRQIYQTCLPTATVEDTEAFYHTYVSEYGPFSEQYARMLPGAADVLPLLKAQNKKIALATTKARTPAMNVLKQFSLFSYFDAVFGVDSVTLPKPDPEIIHKALAECGVDASRAVMIGDTTLDMDAGRGAGVHTIGVLTGTHSRETLQSSQPTLIVESLEELKAFI